MDDQRPNGGQGYPTSIFDLAERYPLGGSRDAQALAVLFDISHADALCRVTEELSLKYGTSGIAACINDSTFCLKLLLKSFNLQSLQDNGA